MSARLGALSAKKFIIGLILTTVWKIKMAQTILMFLKNDF